MPLLNDLTKEEEKEKEKMRAVCLFFFFLVVVTAFAHKKLQRYVCRVYRAHRLLT